MRDDGGRALLPPDDRPAPPGLQKATFAAGCFWCLDAIYRKTRGVNLSIKAKDQAEQNEAMQKLAADNGGNAGTTNLGALLKAKLNQQ